GALEMLQVKPRPTAVFVIADRLALGVLQALQEARLTVPGDVALASYNNIEAASLVHPGLTTSTFPAYEMGLLAMERLKRLLSGEPVDDETILLETHLVVRQSCGCP
ncbi:MAG: LacI family transcriptional regulator, partial [Anaerolineales bacterium]